MHYAAIARARQARFRATLPPGARTPTDEIGRRHGHLLALGWERHNLFPELRGPGGAIDVFRSRRIRWWRSPRSGDPPGRNGPTRNLTSSQVACVNFLLPLARRPRALVAFLRLLDPDVEGAEPIPDRAGAQPARVEFEWVGWDAPLEGGPVVRGATQTSADALVVARTPTGRRAYLFEWKYAESYPRPTDKGAGRSGDVRRRRYATRYRAPDSSFIGDVPLGDFMFEPYYQLLRLRLLADDVRRRGVAPGLPVDEARVVVVCPAANRDYREPVSATPLARRRPDLRDLGALLRTTLKRPDAIRLVATEALVAGLRASPEADDLAEWLQYHALRYGW